MKMDPSIKHFTGIRNNKSKNSNGLALHEKNRHHPLFQHRKYHLPTTNTNSISHLTPSHTLNQDGRLIFQEKIIRPSPKLPKANFEFISKLNHPLHYNLKHGSLDMKTALELSNLCLLSYDDREIIEKNLFHNGFKTFHYLGSNDLWPKAIIAANDQSIFVCFRGTKSSWDWLTNIDLAQVQVPTGNGKVHKGIYRATLQRYAEISDIVRELQSKLPRPLYLTGHSLGGGMAIVAASMMNSDTMPPNAVYTFGSPKIGDAQFAKEYALNPTLHQNTFRFVNYCDPVPKIPYLDNFVHVSPSQEHLFTTDGRMLVGVFAESSSSDNLINTLPSFSSSCPINFEIVDSHLVESYIENLNKAFTKQIKNCSFFLKPANIGPKKSDDMKMEL
jgi:triacylglycerol lipase